MPYFDSNFTKSYNSNGKVVYTFNTCYKETPETYNKKHPLSVDGSVLYSSCSPSECSKALGTAPDDISNPTVLKAVFEQWLRDCSGAFVKPPTVEKCLAKCTSLLDSQADVVSLLSEEEDKDWLLQWVPTTLHVDAPWFIVHWSPCYKVPYTRPANEQIELDDEAATVEVQNPEKTYTILPQATRLVNGEWMQELTDVSLPLSDSPALRLDIDLEAQKEKMRRRIRDARIRAKLARYRAERLASRFEAKFGEYPSEDDEEAQTEAETEGDE